MAEPTGLGAIKRTLFDLIEKTLIPRGRESASILYGTEGWVSHGLAYLVLFSLAACRKLGRTKTDCSTFTVLLLNRNAFGWTGMNGDYETAAEWSDCRSLKSLDSSRLDLC
jgi:hypothetical protein